MSHHQIPSNRPKILFISGFLPSDRVPSGGQKLVFAELQSLAREATVDLVAFYNKKESPYLAQAKFAGCRHVVLIPVTLTNRISGAIFKPQLPLYSSARWMAGFGKVRELLTKESYDHVWIEFLQAASLLALIPKTTSTRVVVHDIFSEAFKRRSLQATGLRRALLRLEFKRAFLWEQKILKRPDKIYSLTSRESALIQEMTGRGDTIVRYPQASADIINLCRPAENIKKHSILFFGQMSRDENADAAIWFARKILPLIRKEIASARFIIAGANPGPEVLALQSHEVDVIGFVEQPPAVLATCHIAIAPLRLGSGVKIKVIEYLAAGIPTVATSIGAEGVNPSEKLFVRDDEMSFAQACLDLLKQSY